MYRNGDEMKPGQTSDFCRPFKDLQTMLKNKSVPLAHADPKPSSKHADDNRTADDFHLFQEAMADVEPLRCNKPVHPIQKCNITTDSACDGDRDTVNRLRKLIKCGEGFFVADTPEYMEGRGPKSHPEITARLHQGAFSIQGHIDLHGFSVASAYESLDAFLKDAVRAGKRAILIIHGRGLSSPAAPVLKSKVYEWLTRGPWRKWVIAFSSAETYDGGAGATYVLLRERPLTRRHRKPKHQALRR